MNSAIRFQALKTFPFEYVASLQKQQKEGKQQDIIDFIPQSTGQQLVSSDQIEILKNHVGKLDGYTEMRGLKKNREILAQSLNEELSLKIQQQLKVCQKDNNEQQQQKEEDFQIKINEDDIFFTFGVETCYWLVSSLLLEQDEIVLIPKIIQPYIYNSCAQRMAQIKQYEDFETLVSMLNEYEVKSVYIQNPQFLGDTILNGEQIQTLIKLALEKNIVLVIEGQYNEFFIRNYNQANIIGIETFRQFQSGWKINCLILQGIGFNIEVKKGILNLLDIILMTNTISQSAFQELQQKYGIDLDLKNQQENQVIFNNMFEKCSNIKIYGNYGVLKMNKFKKYSNENELSSYLFKKYGYILYPGSLFGIDYQVLVFGLDQKNLEYIRKLAQVIESEII
ncbi:Pyridoxal phosphate-dependent transferase [Pseudocohnilembus persalinus]|uniref:Pyridoxal phosphate-dependent transferase n=1 Tax=Pseudocohnilembus persalinus TaxID=266149 RepID=A0A0V0R9V4_PSEPJ|nr:Pyridoxal phosphate-dependent transferase [Pseudocohnilembus persalinus]|eukprot:KRX11246.1 Pyridoxal phosphate-dependent transferase [Pseudocohnilembus persalinus]